MNDVKKPLRNSWQLVSPVCVTFLKLWVDQKECKRETYSRLFKIIVLELFVTIVNGLRGHPFSKIENFPKKLTFLTPWYAHIRDVSEGKKSEFFRKHYVPYRKKKSPHKILSVKNFVTGKKNRHFFADFFSPDKVRIKSIITKSVNYLRTKFHYKCLPESFIRIFKLAQISEFLKFACNKNIWDKVFNNGPSKIF